MIIDNEFKGLIPPLTDEEYKGLEESILKDGCRDALVLWGEILVDGHNRYEICTRHNIPFKTVQKEFTSRDDVIRWIILNQFGRRNLPAYERARLALRLKPVISEQREKNLHLSQGSGVKGTQNSADVNKGETRQELAKIAGVSHDTIAKAAGVKGVRSGMKANTIIQKMNKSGINYSYEDYLKGKKFN